MLKVEPVTLEVFKGDYCAGQKIREKLVKNFSKLKELNDWLLDQINSFDDLPADTRFPGFFTSLADHSTLTSAVAIAIALDLKRKGVDFKLDSQGEFSEEFSKLLDDENSLKEVVRCAALLHDIGKQPWNEHYLRTEKYANEILKIAGFSEISDDLARLAARHHYGGGYPEEYKPRTKIEWVVAIADKVSVLERLPFAKKEVIEAYYWILNKLNGTLTSDDKEKIAELIEYLEGKRKEFTTDPPLLPTDLEKFYRLDRPIFNPKEFLGEEPKIGVFCLEIAGIQKFITASDFRRYVSGASSLLENVLTEIKEYLENLLAPESVIYAKGGSLLAIVPESYYEEIKRQVINSFKRRTELARAKIPPKNVFSYSLSEIKYGPKVCQDNEDFVERRNFGSVVSRTLNFLEMDLELKEEFGTELRIPVGNVCRCCYEQKGEISREIDGDEVKICRRCDLVLKEYQKTREPLLFSLKLEKLAEEILERLENETWRKIVEKFKEKVAKSAVVSSLLLKGVKSLVFKPVETWNYLGRQHLPQYLPLEIGEARYDMVYDIAFVKGDGDNFGRIKEIASSPALYKQISSLFEEVIEASIVEGFSEILLKELELFDKILEYRIKNGENVKSNYTLEIPFDIVYIGGDDFLVLMDAAYTYVFLKAYRKNVQRILGKKRENYEKELQEPLSIFPLGVSIGVAVVKNRAPVASTLSALNSMLKRAKEKSKSDKRPFGSEIYVYIQKFDQIPTKDEVEAQEMFTSFPMDGEELEDFIEWIKFFASKKISPNWIKRVFGEEKPKSYAEACINLLFKMARTDKNSNEFEALKKLYELHKKFELGESTKYCHLDISDALKVLTENVESELREIVIKTLLGD